MQPLNKLLTSYTKPYTVVVSERIFSVHIIKTGIIIIVFEEKNRAKARP